jgi:hypothetical protein
MPVGYKNLPTESEEQIIFTIDEDSNCFLVNISSNQQRLRILTLEEIQNMGNDSFDPYREAVENWETRVHTCGTPQATRAYDYLLNATSSERHSRAVDNLFAPFL